MGSKKPGAHRVELLGYLIVCAVDSVAGSGIGWFHGCAAAAVHNVPAIAAIKVRTLMPLGWMTGAMNRRGWIVENLFAYRVVL